MFARVPVPWGAEPKAQTVSATFAKPLRWYNGEQEIPDLEFSALVTEVSIPVIYKSLLVTPSARAKQQPLLSSTPKWAVIKGIFKDEVAAPKRSLAMLASPHLEASWIEQRVSIDGLAVAKAIKKSPRPEKLEPLDPFTTKSWVSSLEQAKQDWVDQLPPSLLAWAVARGIKKLPAEQIARLDPFSTRTKVISLEDRRAIMAALKRGEWCLVSDLEIFPPRLKQWLIECRVRFIRYIGGGTIGQGTPVNGYVTEAGTVFYTAEDGSTFYVQES